MAHNDRYLRRRPEEAVILFCTGYGGQQDGNEELFYRCTLCNCLVLVFLDLSMEELEAMEYESQCVAVFDGTKVYKLVLVLFSGGHGWGPPVLTALLLHLPYLGLLTSVASL